jgi:hypothetical protein
MNLSLFSKISRPNGYTIEISKWAFILMDFMGFFFKDFQCEFTIPIKNNIFQYGFHLVLKGFINEYNCSNQIFTNEILEFNIMSIWIIYKNVLRTFGSSTFALNEPLQCAYTHFLFYFFLCVCLCYKGALWP